MTLQNPLAILQQFSPQAQALTGQIGAGQQVAGNRLALQQQEALNPLLLEQQQLANQVAQEQATQQGIQTRGLESQENIQNTVGRLQELERQIGFGATPEQLAGTLQGYIAESQARGGNPADSQQALQALQQGGVEGLQGLLGQAKQVFQQQGLMSQPALSEERKLDILGQQKLELEKIKGEQNRALAELKAGMDAEPDMAKQADSLRKEITDINKRLKFDDTKSAFGRIKTSSEGTAAGDLSLIFNYMKMLDPGSTVREGEFATAQNAQGVGGRITSLYNQILSGERLTQDQRDEFTSLAEKLFDQSTANFKQAIRPVLNIGKSRELSEDDILGEGFFESLAFEPVDNGDAVTTSSVVDPNTNQEVTFTIKRVP